MTGIRYNLTDLNAKLTELGGAGAAGGGRDAVQQGADGGAGHGWCCL